MTQTEVLVYQEAEPCRLDLFLAGELELPRSKVAKLIDGGAVKAYRGKIKAARLCRAGDRFEVCLPEPEPSRITPQPMDIAVYYADAHCAVVEKPAGLAVHPGAGRPDGTLINGLMDCFPQLEVFGETLRPGIVHRLDLGTSGLLVVALTPEAALELAAQFANRETEKHYLALVHGRMQQTPFEVNAPIGRDRYNPLKRSARDDGKPAQSVFTPIWRRHGACLTQVQIFTGRTHQIRVHTAAMGLYLDGDMLYGPKVPEAHWVQNRLFLHAAHLAFYHPFTGEPLAFDSPLPEELELLAHRLQDELPKIEE